MPPDHLLVFHWQNNYCFPPINCVYTITVLIGLTWVWALISAPLSSSSITTSHLPKLAAVTRGVNPPCVVDNSHIQYQLRNSSTMTAWNALVKFVTLTQLWLPSKCIRAPDPLRALHILVANAKLYLTASRPWLLFLNAHTAVPALLYIHLIGHTKQVGISSRTAIHGVWDVSYMWCMANQYEELVSMCVSPEEEVVHDYCITWAIELHIHTCNPLQPTESALQSCNLWIRYPL